VQSINYDKTSRRTAIAPCNSAGRPSSSASTSLKKIRNDLRCEHCHQAEASHLIYYRRYHIESGRFSLINPMIVCDNCIQLFRDSNLLLEHQPVIVPFQILAKWDDRLMGITSKKQWEFSVFRNKFWRKRLFRIRYIWKNPPKNKDLQ